MSNGTQSAMGCVLNPLGAHVTGTHHAGQAAGRPLGTAATAAEHKCRNACLQAGTQTVLHCLLCTTFSQENIKPFSKGASRFCFPLCSPLLCFFLKESTWLNFSLLFQSPIYFSVSPGYTQYWPLHAAKTGWINVCSTTRCHPRPAHNISHTEVSQEPSGSCREKDLF